MLQGGAQDGKASTNQKNSDSLNLLWIYGYNRGYAGWINNIFQVDMVLPHNLMCNPLTGQAVSRKVRLTR